MLELQVWLAGCGDEEKVWSVGDLQMAWPPSAIQPVFKKH